MIENEPTFDLPNNIGGNNNILNSNNTQINNNKERLNDIYLSPKNAPKKPKQNNLAYTSLNYLHKHNNFGNNNSNLNALELNSQIYQAFLLNPIFERKKKRRSSTYLSTVGVNTNSNTLNNNNNDLAKKRNSLSNNNINMHNNNLINASNKKKKKSVRFSDPFIIDIPIESLKEFNLKMTYDYEQVPDLMISDRICPCKMCLIF